MTIWTVVSRDDTDNGSDHLVAGSYTSRERAIDECVDYIVERLSMRDDLAYCMAHDEDNPEAAEFFSGKPDRSDHWHVKRGAKTALREFLKDKLGDQGCYYACCDCGKGRLSFCFDVDENDLEGQLWTTVTRGDSNTEDPEFTTPSLETFISEDKAIEDFYRYVLDFKKKHSVEVPKGLKYWVYETLRKHGKCQVDLGNGCSVSCVLSSTPAGGVR